MIIGILSDTHDRVDAMAAGMSALRDGGAEFYIHCGDVGGKGVLDLLAGEPAAFVWGNNDFNREELARYAASLGIACHGSKAELQLGGRRIAVIHGDDLALRASLLASKKFAYLLQGHTHIRGDLSLGVTRLINPGALHRAREKTVALLDTARDAVAFRRVKT